MQRIAIDDLESGMVIARTIIASDGRALLNENTRLNDTFIHRLRLLGVMSVYVKDGLADIEVPEIISSRVRASVSATLNTSLKNFALKKTLDMESMKKLVSMLLEDIITNRNVILHLEDVRSYDDQLLMHSLNVAVFSMMTGFSMGYNEGKLVELGLGTLLHDIGMIMIDPDIIHRRDQLGNSESEIFRGHPEIGFNILRTYREVSTKVAHIAYQHHERFDGSGYPRQLNRKQILEYAKIAAIADAFDNVISDTSSRQGYSANDALTVLRKLGNTYFDPEMIEAFASNVAIYPVGCLLSLNTGHIAVVTSATKINSTRPMVYLICDKEGQLIKPPYAIDLQQCNEVSIIRRLSNQETEVIRTKFACQQKLN
ncbi:MAG: HD domain-containing protein [Syntrophomonadaceae bacterium]|nr:HD domain-containing protein [Syntrophomonadaceae bacterium]MDD3023114.1 HD domain-containing protein [Syntrophomonadaceae bacterium]